MCLMSATCHECFTCLPLLCIQLCCLCDGAVGPVSAVRGLSVSIVWVGDDVLCGTLGGITHTVASYISPDVGGIRASHTFGAVGQHPVSGGIMHGSWHQTRGVASCMWCHTCGLCHTSGTTCCSIRPAWQRYAWARGVSLKFALCHIRGPCVIC